MAKAVAPAIKFLGGFRALQCSESRNIDAYRAWTEIELPVAAHPIDDDRALDAAIVEVEVGLRSEDAPLQADAGDLQVVGLVEIPKQV